jgi:hypothetical protein
VEKSYNLNIPDSTWISNSGGLYTDLSGYFQIVIGALMTATFITIALIVLDAYYGKDEENNEKD